MKASAWQLDNSFRAIAAPAPRPAGLTQEALADRAGLSVYTIQKLERGTTQPYRDTALRLAVVLGLAPDEANRFRAAVAPVRSPASVQRTSR